VTVAPRQTTGHAGAKGAAVNLKQPGFDLGAPPDLLLETDTTMISATDLLATIEKEFGQQGQVPPSGEKILTLARVIVGHLRTSPMPDSPSAEGQAMAVASFVAACPVWWTRDYSDYGKLAALLDDVFHQREVAVPARAAMDMLHGITAGIMRRKRLPGTDVAQLAMADWIAALYLAGLDDW
jgi:hypothetical protein